MKRFKDLKNELELTESKKALQNKAKQSGVSYGILKHFFMTFFIIKKKKK